MSPNSINSYPLSGSGSQKVLSHALQILKPHLPVSIPLYRRLQFGRFFDATVLLTNVPPGSKPPTETTSPWLFAFVDRSCRPETEVWLFGSWEVLSSVPSSAQPAIDDLLKELVLRTKDLGLPTSIHQDLLDAATNSKADAPQAHEQQLQNWIDKDPGGFSRQDYGGHMADTNVMLWGAVHDRSVQIMDRLELLTRKYKAGLMPNSTFVWDVDAMAPVKPLPEGLRWDELRQRHFELVRRRTQIPRQDRTLAVLPNLGLFPGNEDTPIAWAFIGLDASLSSLHVEPAYRGRGLAKAITKRLFEEAMGRFWEDGGQRLAHGYVIVGNAESEGMCRALGGESKWEVYWLRVDLGKV